MSIDTALSIANGTEGAYCLAAIGENLSNDRLYELPFRITCGLIGTYLCSKAGEKFLKIYAPEVIRKTVFSAALATIPYWIQHGNLQQRCSDLTSSFDCSVFGYTNTLVAITASVVALYTIFSFADSTILKYNIDGTEIRFFKKDGKLNYKATSKFHYSEKGTSEECEEKGEIDLPYREAISHFRSGEYELSLNRHSEPVLFKPVLQANSFRVQYEIIFGKTLLAKNIFIDLILKPRKGGIPLCRTDFKTASNATDYSTTDTLDKIWRSSDNLHHINKFFVVEIKPYERIGRATMAPNNRASRIDERVLVSEFYWGITLIGYKGTGNNHALLVLEGVDNGSYFTELADLVEARRVKLKDITDKEIRYCTRSRVWKIRREKGISFLNVVKHQRAKNLPEKFSLRGADSIWSKGADSCMTWTAKRLGEVGVELPPCEIRTVVTPTSWYTQPNWIKLYQDPGPMATTI